MPRVEARSAAAVAALFGGLCFVGGACSGSRARVAPPQGGAGPDAGVAGAARASNGAEGSNQLPVGPSMLASLLREEDCDGDKRITVHDLEVAKRAGRSCAADGVFEVASSDGSVRSFRGTFRLSRLLTELELARRGGRTTIDLARVEEDPVTAVSRAIRERYWDGLTRRLDAAHLDQVLRDPKVTGPHAVIYVPSDDAQAFEYFVGQAGPSTPGVSRPLDVRRLPAVVSPRWVKDLGDAHGPLTLALRTTSSGAVEGMPYVVPGGRFNELYGWDSYFHVLGLLRDGRPELARAIVENFVYEIEHYGRVLNANRTYYLTRSQPPFFTSMLRAVWDVPANAWTHAPFDRPPDRAWLERAVRAAVKEYVGLWQAPARRSTLCDPGSAGAPPICLAHYFDEGVGEPPEVEPGHFAWIYRKYAAKRGMGLDAYTSAYRKGAIREPGLDRFFTHDRCMRESGHDTTYRWFDAAIGEDRCADYVTVDLNSLLYKFETDIAGLLRRYPDLEIAKTASLNAAPAWCDRARARARLMRRHLFDSETSLFFDYDVTRAARSTYLAATTLYPLWASETPTSNAGCDAPLVTAEEAPKLAAAALRRLEGPGGIHATAEDSLKPFAALPPRQWEYPNGWAPHQVLAWEGLTRFGLGPDAERLVYKWLQMIAKNAADYAGTVPEKFDVRARSHRVYAEYGNVGTEFQYITDEGFGWMNASFEDGLARLSPPRLSALRALEEPSHVFGAPRAGPRPSRSDDENPRRPL